MSDFLKEIKKILLMEAFDPIKMLVPKKHRKFLYENPYHPINFLVSSLALGLCLLYYGGGLLLFAFLIFCLASLLFKFPILLGLVIGILITLKVKEEEKKKMDRVKERGQKYKDK
mgnify:CR=1 FL=1|tara:strand:+ start:99 stop:443 length:345 start_codon:yes stop_codon:yes gene_type:complete